MTRLEARSIPDPGEKARLLSFDALDKRTRAVRQVRSFELQLSTDLGGDLSAAQAALARRSAVLVACLSNAEALWASGESLALADYVTATNALRRLLSDLGLKRVARSANGGDRLATLLED